MGKKNLPTKRKKHVRKAPFRAAEYELIDGNLSHHPSAYCKWHKGWLTEGLINTHGCRKKGCNKLEEGVNDEGQ